MNFSCKLGVFSLLFQKTIYITQPTWGNHPKIFTLAGLSVKTYRYYDPSTRGLNFQGEIAVAAQMLLSFMFSYCFSDFFFFIVDKLL